MPSGFAVEPMARGRAWDSALLASLFLLAGTGLAALWSASAGYALSLGKEPHYFALRQLVFYAPALGIFWAAAMVPLEELRGKVTFITLLGLASLFLPLLPGLGENRNGASRWIDLRITTLQPSEFWKPISVFYLAHVLDKRRENVDQGAGVLVAPFLLVGLGCLVIYLQNDFSTAAIAAFAAAAMFWIACAPMGFFLGIATVGLPLGALVILTSDFRLKRMLAFFFPAYEPHGQGYQVLGSIRAITSGGFFGKGLGLGTRKLGGIPEVQSDFVFASWAEETGFVGVLGFFALWAFFAWRAFRNAFAEEDGFRSYLGFGLTTLLLLEVLVNVAVASGALPATGIALPFFSAGGSSLWATVGAVGLIVNVSRSAGAEGGGNV